MTDQEKPKLEHLYGCSYSNPRYDCPACQEEHKDATARGEKWWHSAHCTCRDCR